MKIRLLIATALMIASSAWATPLVSYTHDYTSQGGSWRHPVTYDYITINDRQGWWDGFDFSALDYSSIDHFELTLSFANASGGGTRRDPEAWSLYVQAWDAYAPVAASALKTTYVIDADTPWVFATILDDEYFSFWFGDSSRYSNDFLLYSATLSIYGEAEQVSEPAVPATPATPATPANGATLPEPASLTLLGLGLAGLGGIRRRRQKA